MENSYLIPMVIDKDGQHERSYDIYSRLLKERIVFLGSPVDDNVANVIIAQLLYLQSVNATKPVSLYINSPGGVVTAGLAIYDTIQFLKPPVHTFCIGQCSSMGALLLTAGAKGGRFAMAHSRIMIHQPSGGAQGQATDIQIQADEIQRMKKELTQIIAHHSGQKYEKVLKDCERDKFMSAEEAKKYGLIDEIIGSKVS